MTSPSLSPVSYNPSISPLGMARSPLARSAMSLAFVNNPPSARVANLSTGRYEIRGASELVGGRDICSQLVWQPKPHMQHLALMNKGNDEDDFDIECDTDIHDGDDKNQKCIVNFSWKKLTESYNSFAHQGFKVLENALQPFNLLNRLAEDRANLDERNNPVIKTALTVAAMKLAAGVLTDDTITKILVGEKLLFGMSLLVNSMPKVFEELGVVSRTPWIDSRITDIISNESVDQVVFLGAGLDTRAFRLPALRAADVYELDLPELISVKEQLFTEIADDAQQQAKSLTRIGTDLSQIEWVQHLIESGFNPEKPTLFIMEGLIYYLDEGQVEALGRQIRNCSAEGSHLLFDCINTESIRLRSFDKLVGKPSMFVSAMDEPELWLNHIGFDESVVVQPGEIESKSNDHHSANRGNKVFHRPYLGTYDSHSYLIPRNETAPDGGDVRRFFFVEGIIAPRR